MILYSGLKHFKYAGIRVEPGLVFHKMAVRQNLFLEQRGYLEEYRGREDDLVSCKECPAKFSEIFHMQRHVEKNRHLEGKVVYSEEGIRTSEQEQEIDEAQQRMRNESGPGFEEADAAGNTTRKPRKIKSRR